MTSSSWICPSSLSRATCSRCRRSGEILPTISSSSICAACWTRRSSLAWWFMANSRRKKSINRSTPFWAINTRLTDNALRLTKRLHCQDHWTMNTRLTGNTLPPTTGQFSTTNADGTIERDSNSLAVSSNMSTPKLKAVGYWWSDDDWTLPHPKWLVQPDWQPADRATIVRYLQSGQGCIWYLGYSWCRFGCDNDTNMGTSCLTDGNWIWPEGLAHYVEQHGLRLPDEFIDTMRQNGWKVPEAAKRLADLDEWPGDCSFWIDWCRQQGIPMESFRSGFWRRPDVWKEYYRQRVLAVTTWVAVVLLLLFFGYLTVFHGLR
jgi:hypothetical protein